MKPKRYVLNRKPITANGSVIGWIVHYSDGSSNYEQRKVVKRGNCVNLGLRFV